MSFLLWCCVLFVISSSEFICNYFPVPLSERVYMNLKTFIWGRRVDERRNGKVMPFSK